MSTTGTQKAPIVDCEEDVISPIQKRMINASALWLLSPFWLAFALIAISHLSPSANQVIQYLTQSPLR